MVRRVHRAHVPSEGWLELSAWRCHGIVARSWNVWRSEDQVEAVNTSTVWMCQTPFGDDHRGFFFIPACAIVFQLLRRVSVVSDWSFNLPGLHTESMSLYVPLTSLVVTFLLGFGTSAHPSTCCGHRGEATEYFHCGHFYSNSPVLLLSGFTCNELLRCSMWMIMRASLTTTCWKWCCFPAFIIKKKNVEMETMLREVKYYWAPATLVLLLLCAAFVSNLSALFLLEWHHRPMFPRPRSDTPSATPAYSEPRTIAGRLLPLECVHHPVAQRREVVPVSWEQLTRRWGWRGTYSP